MRPSTRKASAAALCVLLTVCVSPLQAFAATSVYVGNDYYDSATYPAGTSGSGSTSGAWTWDGANNMTLDNYNGGSIISDGNLNIALSDANTVDTAEMPYGVYVFDGDLSITGDGNLDVNVDGNANRATGIGASGDLSITGDGNLDVNVGGKDGQVCGIRAGKDLSITGNGSCDVKVSAPNSMGIMTDNGDLNINGTTVNVNTSGSSAAGMGAKSGNVTITDSSVSSIASNSSSYYTSSGAIFSGGYNKSGSITITGSDVTAKSSSQGIVAYAGKKATGAPQVIIADSNVTAEGDDGAIAAHGVNASYPGTIAITGSSIVAPAGAHLQDVADSGNYFYGQAIGTGSGTITQVWFADGSPNPEVAKSVTIEKIPAAADPATPTAVAPATAAAGTAATSPKTADEAPVALLALTLSAAGGALVASRRKLSAKR